MGGWGRANPETASPPLRGSGNLRAPLAVSLSPRTENIERDLEDPGLKGFRGRRERDRQRAKSSRGGGKGRRKLRIGGKHERRIPPSPPSSLPSSTSSGPVLHSRPASAGRRLDGGARRVWPVPHLLSCAVIHPQIIPLFKHTLERASLQIGARARAHPPRSLFPLPSRSPRPPRCLPRVPPPCPAAGMRSGGGPSALLQIWLSLALPKQAAFFPPEPQPPFRPNSPESGTRLRRGDPPEPGPCALLPREGSQIRIKVSAAAVCHSSRSLQISLIPSRPPSNCSNPILRISQESSQSTSAPLPRRQGGPVRLGQRGGGSPFSPPFVATGPVHPKRTSWMERLPFP